MYVVISRTKAKEGKRKEISKRAKEFGNPPINHIKGFKSYYVIETGPDEWATIAVFEDKAGAQEWKRTAGKYSDDAHLREYLAAPNKGGLQLAAGNVIWSVHSPA